MEGDCEWQTRTTYKTHDPDRHATDSQTNILRTNRTHGRSPDHDEGGTYDDGDDDTLLILSQLIES